MNLFKLDLEQSLSYELLSNFLGINLQEHERLAEGMLVDYKLQFPSDFGETVTAFANTYGGLIILGVEEKKFKEISIPHKIVGLQESHNEIKCRIINHISATVWPRPRFSIGIVATPEDPPKYVAVVRVEEGEEPPYMYIGGQANRIAVRIGSSTRGATLGEIKELFGESRRSQEQMERGCSSLYDPYVTDGKGRTAAFQKFVWVPSHALKVRLERKVDESIHQFIQGCFKLDRGSKETSRTAEYTDFDSYNKEWNYHRKWRFSDRGALCFVSKMGRVASAVKELQSDAGEEIDRVGDWILDALAFIKLMQRVANYLEYVGNGIFIHTLSYRQGDKVLIYDLKRTSMGYQEMDSITLRSLSQRQVYRVNGGTL